MDKNIEFIKYFPNEIKSVLINIPEHDINFINEINVINGQPLLVKIRGKNRFIGQHGPTNNISEALVSHKNLIDKMFELITKSSTYSYSRFINDGFITLDNGHRVGIVGDCVFDNEKVTNIHNINSLCFRVSRNILSSTDIIFNDIYHNGIIKNTLVISPPGCGKTTFLRSITKRLCELYKENNIILALQEMSNWNVKC